MRLFAEAGITTARLLHTCVSSGSQYASMPIIPYIRYNASAHKSSFVRYPYHKLLHRASISSLISRTLSIGWLGRAHERAYERVHELRDLLVAHPAQHVFRHRSAGVVFRVCPDDFDLRPSKPVDASLALYSSIRSAPATHPAHSARCFCAVSEIGLVRTMSATANARRFENAKRLREYTIFVGGEVDHAVADDHVHRAVRQRDVFDLAFEKLDVLHACLALVTAGEFEHFVVMSRP